MADSDNSTTLPFDTRWRKSDIIVAADGMPADAPKVCRTAATDPVVVLAEIWRNAHARTLALCRHQQRLESRIARKIGFPPSASSDNLPKAKRWQQADLELGYSKAKAAEERTAQAAERLLEEIARTPAQSIDGVIAKLEVVLLGSEIGDAPSSFPWPHLRSVLADLKRYAASEPPS